MPDKVSFLNTTFKSLRCQNPACQAEAMHEKRITLGNLLFTGWTCHYCGLFHEGAFASPVPISTIDECGVTLLTKNGELAAEEVAEKVIDPKETDETPEAPPIDPDLDTTDDSAKISTTIGDDDA